MVEGLKGWYTWRTEVIWQRAWAAHEPSWRPIADELRGQVDRLVAAFTTAAVGERREYERLSREVYEARTGVLRLLPSPGGPGDYYRAAREYLRERAGVALDLPFDGGRSVGGENLRELGEPYLRGLQ